MKNKISEERKKYLKKVKAKKLLVIVTQLAILIGFLAIWEALANAKIIDNLTNSIVNKIFFDISKKIKQAAHENDEELIRAIEFMFEEK